MAENKKYFLDLAGLGTLWEKIKANFANKKDTDDALKSINASLSALDGDLETALNSVLSISPKEVSKYSNAEAIANSIAPGVVIKVNNAETIDGVTKPAGIYIVESRNPAKLVYVGSADASVGDIDIEALLNRISAIESTAIKKAIVTDGTNQLSNLTVASNTLVIVRDDKLVVDSDSINALTHRAVAAKFKQIEGLITTIPKFKIAVVDELPVSDISSTTIYLVKNNEPTSSNIYTEYIYIEEASNSWVWEKLGEQTLDLSDAVSVSQVISIVNDAIKDLASVTYVNNSIAQAKQEIKNDISETLKNEYITKLEAPDLIESVVLTSIQTGEIGDAIAITNEQIESVING